jgi:hypothetical protein
MKNNHMKKTILLSFLTGTVWLAFETFSAISNAGGPPLGKTGAPGEGLCTECHADNAVNSGGAEVKTDYTYNGSNDSTYNPDLGANSYQTFSTLVETGSASSGIEMTMVDEKGNGAGEFTANNTNKTSVAMSNGRSYFYHIKKGNQNPGANDWGATWTPPSTNKGVLTLYTAYNGSDDDGTSSGDFIYTTSKKIYLSPDFSGVEWQKNNAMKLAVFPTTVSNEINFSYTNTKDQQIAIELIDLNGNSVHTFMKMNQHQGDNNLKFDMPKVSSGLYFVKITAGAQQTTKKVFVL